MQKNDVQYFPRPGNEHFWHFLAIFGKFWNPLKVQIHQNLQKYSNIPPLDKYRSPEIFLKSPALLQRIYCILGPVLSIFQQKNKKNKIFITDWFDHPYTVLNYCENDRELFKAHILCAIGQGYQLIMNLGRGITKG